jgi:hypothetical protein
MFEFERRLAHVLRAYRSFRWTAAIELMVPLFSPENRRSIVFGARHRRTADASVSDSSASRLRAQPPVEEDANGRHDDT